MPTKKNRRSTVDPKSETLQAQTLPTLALYGIHPKQFIRSVKFHKSKRFLYRGKQGMLGVHSLIHRYIDARKGSDDVEWKPSGVKVTLCRPRPGARKQKRNDKPTTAGTRVEWLFANMVVPKALTAVDKRRTKRAQLVSDALVKLRDEYGMIRVGHGGLVVGDIEARIATAIDLLFVIPAEGGEKDHTIVIVELKTGSKNNLVSYGGRIKFTNQDGSVSFAKDSLYIRHQIQLAFTYHMFMKSFDVGSTNVRCQLLQFQHAEGVTMYGSEKDAFRIADDIIKKRIGHVKKRERNKI